jgi:plastocyanin domain-containing protein
MLRILFSAVVLLAVGCSQKKPVLEGRRVEIAVTGKGYEPAIVTAAPGEKLVLVFTASGWMGCCGDIVVTGTEAAGKVTQSRPLELAVTVPASGHLGFACTMDMCKGEIGPAK